MEKIGMLLIIIGLAISFSTAFTFLSCYKVVETGKIEVTRYKYSISMDLSLLRLSKWGLVGSIYGNHLIKTE
jgi:hypothetical protein